MKFSRYIEINKPNDSGLINGYLNLVSGGGEMTVKELVKAGGEIVKEAKNQKQKARFFESVDGYNYKSLFSFSLAEWIDFENFMKAEDIARALTVVYRKKEGSDLNADKWEDWGGYSGKRTALFNDMEAWKMLGAINRATNEKEAILKQHEAIFDSEFDYKEELEQATEEKDKEVIRQEIEKDKLKNKYNLEFLILDLADGDFTKIDKVMKMNINTLFHFLGVSKLKKQL